MRSMTTKVITGGVLPDFGDDPEFATAAFKRWWNETTEEEERRRKEEAEAAKREASLQRLYDAIDATFSRSLQKELATENEVARVTPKQRADFAAFQAGWKKLGTPYLPAAPQSVAMFLVGESDHGVAHMSRLRNSIATIHKAVGFSDDCTTDVLVRAIMRCAREEEHSQERK